MSENIRDIREHEFQAAVLTRSMEIPVVVDFWSPRCTPCEVLGPLLEEMALEMKGSFELVKVNVDEAPRISSALKIRGIPAVKVFVDGRIVNQVTGALPREELRAFLKKVCPSKAEALVVQGKALEGEGRIQEALRAYEEAHGLDGEHPDARLGVARACLALGKLDRVKTMIDPLPDHMEEEVQPIREALRWHEEADQAGGEEELRQRLREEPESLEARYFLATLLAARGQYEEALEELFQVLLRNRAFMEGAAHRSIISIFSLMGGNTERIKPFRSRLASLLY